MSVPQIDVPSKKLKVIGLLVTSLYLLVLVIGAVALTKLGWIELKPIELNQLGDLLAGLFGPLAIFWLILGFFQQGDELRNSVLALKLQAEELKNSVEQQKELVEVSRQAIQIEKERVKALELQRSLDLDPVLHPEFGLSNHQDGTSIAYQYRLKLTGRTIREINIHFIVGTEFILSERLDTLAEGWMAGENSRIFLSHGGRITENTLCCVTYRREDGSKGEQVFEFVVPQTDSMDIIPFQFKRRF